MKMSIILTKLLKKKVESPVVEANDFILEGVHLQTKLFLGDTYERSINTQLELLKGGNTIIKYAAEQINGFIIPIHKDMYFGNLKRISLGRSDNTLNSCNAGQRPVYMSITFYDYYLNVADKFHSVLPVQQKSSDDIINSIHITTWDFGEIYIKKNYSYMLCKFTLVVGTDQPRCSARSNYMGARNPLTDEEYKLYLNGWKTIYPVTDDRRYQPYTSYVVVDYDEFIPGINSHIDDYTIHLSQEDRLTISLKFNKLDSHYDDDSRHMTALEKLKLQSLGGDISGLLNYHTNQEGLHWTSDDRKSIVSINSSISTVSNELKNHKADMNLHWSVSDKMKINECIEHIPNINQKFEDIQSELENTLQTSYTTLREGLELVSGGRMATKVIQLSRAHFTDGKIKEIHIPYYNYSQSDSGKTANLCVQIFYAGLNEQTIKPDSECFWSTDVITQDKYGTSFPNDAGVSIFRFDNLEIPRDYSFVRLCFVSDIGQNPNGVDNCVEYRIQVLSLKGNSSSSGYTSFDDDLCKLLPSGGNYYGYVNVIKANKLEEITDFQTKFDYFSNHVSETRIHVSPDDRTKWDNHADNDDIHVTAEEKEKWNNIVIPEIPEIPEPITYTAGDGIDITDNTISVITTDVIEESDKIPTSKALYNTFYGTRTFNNYDTSKYTDGADTVGTIVLSKKHFVKDCKITKFALPHDKDIDNGEGGHLVIEVFAEDSSKADGYDKANPIHRYYSDNYYAYKMNTQYGKYEWTFNNTECLIPSDYKVVHLSLVTNDTIVPSIGSSNNNKLRINCLAKNGDRDEGVVYEEDDECKLYWKGNDNPNVGGANRVAIVQVEIFGNKLDDFSIVPMLLERIAALEAKVSELENS